MPRFPKPPGYRYPTPRPAISPDPVSTSETTGAIRPGVGPLTYGGIPIHFSEPVAAVDPGVDMRDYFIARVGDTLTGRHAVVVQMDDEIPSQREPRVNQLLQDNQLATYANNIWLSAERNRSIIESYQRMAERMAEQMRQDNE